MDKQLVAKKEEEKKLYRSQLVNFMEEQSIKVETISENGKPKKCIIRAMNPTQAQNHINELKKLAKDLIPTNPKEPTEQTEQMNPNNPTEQTDYSRSSEADD